MLKKLRFLPSEIKLSELEAGAVAPPKRIQVMRTGKFRHPDGNFNITKEHLDGFVKNFNDNTRGIDIMLDYKHDSEAEAAAWFKGLEVQPLENANEYGLFAEVDWTEPGAEKVSKKEFRYVSADFTLRYKDNETGKDFGPVLLGAGLTNRPFIKGMEPVVQLSENEKGVTGMNLEQALAKIAELEAKLAQMGGMPEQMGQMKQQLSDAQKEIDAYKAKEAEADKAVKMAEKTSKFDRMLSEKKVVEAQRAPFMADDFAKFAELAQPVLKDKKLSEGGEGGEGGEGDSDAQDQIIKLAEGLVKEGKVKSLRGGISMVLADPANKKLAEEYNSLV